MKRNEQLHQENTIIPVKAFISSASENERQLVRLEPMLKSLEQQYGLSSWWYKRMTSGVEWGKAIHNNLWTMNIFVFIASQASLVSSYIIDKELTVAEQRQKLGEIEIVTIKLEPCSSDEHPFIGRFQRLAFNFNSVAETKVKAAIWEQIRQDLVVVIDRVGKRMA